MTDKNGSADSGHRTRPDADDVPDGASTDASDNSVEEDTASGGAPEGTPDE